MTSIKKMHKFQGFTFSDINFFIELWNLHKWRLPGRCRCSYLNKTYFLYIYFYYKFDFLDFIQLGMQFFVMVWPFCGGHLVLNNLNIKLAFLDPKSIRIPAVQKVHLLLVFWSAFLATPPLCVCYIKNDLPTLASGILRKYKPINY